eukprot:gene2267-7827_t
MPTSCLRSFAGMQPRFDVPLRHPPVPPEALPPLH